MKTLKLQCFQLELWTIPQAYIGMCLHFKNNVNTPSQWHLNISVTMHQRVWGQTHPNWPLAAILGSIRLTLLRVVWLNCQMTWIQGLSKEGTELHERKHMDLLLLWSLGALLLGIHQTWEAGKSLNRYEYSDHQEVLGRQGSEAGWGRSSLVGWGLSWQSIYKFN
jgi:hypothetical protein